jgi:Arc/MetJ-type ribon-helix-helix transcriptional regulator
MEEEKVKKEAEPEKPKKEPEPEVKDKKYYQAKLENLGSDVEKFAIKASASIKKAIDQALTSRNTVLTIRVNDESNRKLNMLVDAGLFKSRSESAAFLIEEGIKSQSYLFQKITERLEKIDRIKEELKTIVSEEIQKNKK